MTLFTPLPTDGCIGKCSTHEIITPATVTAIDIINLTHDFIHFITDNDPPEQKEGLFYDPADEEPDDPVVDPVVEYYRSFFEDPDIDVTAFGFPVKYPMVALDPKHDDDDPDEYVPDIAEDPPSHGVAFCTRSAGLKKSQMVPPLGCMCGPRFKSGSCTSCYFIRITRKPTSKHNALQSMRESYKRSSSVAKYCPWKRARNSKMKLWKTKLP
jgi:hypothetical protein